MNAIQSKLLTKEGMKQLRKEFDTLKNIKRPGVVLRLSTAREQGDLSENSEYAAAKQELSFIDGRIAEIEELIRGAKVIVRHKKSSVDVGCKVTLHIDGKEEIFTVVGEWEADPTKKKISHSSPLGKALIGKKRGETAEVEAPAGKILYKILHIS